MNAVKSPGIFPDERDMILTKLNMVQASAGTGTGLVNYGGQHQTVNFTPDSVLCRFKVSKLCVCVCVCVCVSVCMKM